jgi:type I restriction-modification system DNA methylase subunit
MQGSLFQTSNKYLDIQETLSILGVSSATVRNWIKHEYLTPQKMYSKKLTFDYEQVNKLKEKIASGELNRLNKRANKKHSSTTFIPDEYAENQEVKDFVQEVVEGYKNNSLAINTTLFILTLNLLKQAGLIQYEKPLSNFDRIFTKNEVIKREINWWLDHIEKTNFTKFYSNLLNLSVPKVHDILGLIYQSITAEGNKSQAGAYYTPKKVVKEIVDLYVQEDFLILDPCCGTGQFLLCTLEKIKKPGNVWGFDIDEVAVRLARINVLLKFPDIDFTPHIYHKNTLLEIESKEISPSLFDAIITNPPWGVHFSSNETDKLQSLYPSIKSGEAFSYFIQKGLHLLKEGGILSFVLPESLLNIKTHRDIRKIIVDKTNIIKIKYLDRVFKNVFTPIIRLDIKKSSPDEFNKFEAEKVNIRHTIEQSKLKNNADFIFNVFSSTEDTELFEKIYSKEHTTLVNNAEWALGIVTGDNKKYLADYRTDQNEPLLTGKNVNRFLNDEPKKFIKFDPAKFQQVAPEHKYRAKEKLIYKFISKELVFSYDNNQSLTLNSANILIPKVKDYPIKTILALFNSSLYQFLHQKMFGSLKILKGDLEKLPLPTLNEKHHSEIINLTDQLLNPELPVYTRQEIFKNLDDYVMDLFNLNSREKTHIKTNIKISDKLLSTK